MKETKLHTEDKEYMKKIFDSLDYGEVLNIMLWAAFCKRKAIKFEDCVNRGMSGKFAYRDALNLVKPDNSKEAKKEEISQRLKEQFNWYIENQDSIADLYDGKHLVIVNKRVVAHFDDSAVAYWYGYQNYGLGNFLLHQSGRGKENYTQIFNTPNVKF